MNIVIFKDSDTEMMGIEINQKSVFYGNYWDFSVPNNDLDKLLHEIQKADPSVKVTVVNTTIDRDEDE